MSHCSAAACADCPYQQQHKWLTCLLHPSVDQGVQAGLLVCRTHTSTTTNDACRLQVA